MLFSQRCWQETLIQVEIKTHKKESNRECSMSKYFYKFNIREEKFCRNKNFFRRLESIVLLRCDWFVRSLKSRPRKRKTSRTWDTQNNENQCVCFVHRAKNVWWMCNFVFANEKQKKICSGEVDIKSRCRTFLSLETSNDWFVVMLREETRWTFSKLKNFSEAEELSIESFLFAFRHSFYLRVDRKKFQSKDFSSFSQNFYFSFFS